MQDRRDIVSSIPHLLANVLTLQWAGLLGIHCAGDCFFTTEGTITLLLLRCWLTTKDAQTPIVERCSGRVPAQVEDHTKRVLYVAYQVFLAAVAALLALVSFGGGAKVYRC